MQITIAERLRPVSHQAGVFCVLPLTSLRFQIFPALIRVVDLKLCSSHEIKLDIEGPVLDFTVQQSLEECHIKVWGHSKRGYFRYCIRPSSIGYFIYVEKQPEVAIIKSTSGQNLEIPNREKLSLGVSKAQDWTLVNRRLLLQEIIPFWFALGQLVPFTTPHEEGTASLLKKVQSSIEKRDFPTLTQDLIALYLAGFEGILSPRLVDEQYQGIKLPSVQSKDSSALVLLSQGYNVLRTLFIQQSHTSIAILPCLPPELHCGRMKNISLGSLGTLDIEWSKKTIRRMVFHCREEGEHLFTFQKDLKQYRLRSSKSGKKFVQCGQHGHFQAENIYLFDNFT